MKKYAINGRFFSQRMTGVQRFEREIVRELDKLCEDREIVIVVPPNAEVDIDFRNIKVVRIGRLTGVLWEQISFLLYLLINGFTPINLGNVAPIMRPGIVCVHDMIVIRHPQWFKKAYAIWARFVYHFIFAKAEKILTVSNFSKDEIRKCYPQYKGEIIVVSEGWQHIIRDNEIIEKVSEEAILHKYGLTKKQYIFSNYQRVPYKNFHWVVETAKRNEQLQFAVTGWSNTRVHAQVKEELPANVKMLGYISDFDLKVLLKNCKFFVFPSLYEGFGLPPIEAMALDANVILSNIPVFREIFAKAAVYVEVDEYDIDLNNVNIPSEEEKRRVLSEYSWKSGAERICKVIQGISIR